MQRLHEDLLIKTYNIHHPHPHHHPYLHPHLLVYDGAPLIQYWSLPQPSISHFTTVV